MSLRRFSYNINGNSYRSDGEGITEDYLLNYLRNTNPPHVLVMDNVDLANKIQSLGIDVIFRKYSPEEGNQWNTRTPENYFYSDIDDGNRHLIKYILNEPFAGSNPANIVKLVDWLTRVGQLCLKNGYRCVLGNFATGTFELSRVKQGLYDSLIILSSQNPDKIYLGFHEYTAFWLPYGIGMTSDDELKDVNSGIMTQPADQWPTVDTKGKYVEHTYHILRCHWFKKRGEDIGHPNIKIILTEFFLDRMPDVVSRPNNPYQYYEQNVGVPSGYAYLRGAYTYANVYRRWVGGQKSVAQYIFDQYRWADKIYPDYVKGILSFMWTFDSWDYREGFSFAHDKELHQLFIDNTGEEDMPDVILPDPILWEKRTAKGSRYEDDKPIYSNIRNYPSTSGSTVIGSIGPELIIQLGTNVEHRDSQGYRWWYIKGFNAIYPDNAGWIREDVVEFIDESDGKVVITVTPKNPDDLQLVKKAVDWSLTYLKHLTNEEVDIEVE